MSHQSVSYANLWDGEYGPTIFVDHNREAHRDLIFDSEAGSNFSFTSNGSNFSHTSNGSNFSHTSNGSGEFKVRRRTHVDYGAVKHNRTTSSIRLQVIVWNIGSIDVLNGRVMVKFRVTLFWNDVDTDVDSKNRSNGTKHESEDVPRVSSFTMLGRDRAVLEDDVSKVENKNIDVPPLSILNAESFDVIGRPEVHLLRSKTKLKRWTCLYKATLLQENMKLDNFPHDEHELRIKLGILSNRKEGQRWDKKVWDLQLATEHDSQKSIRTPHGLVVDQVKIPEFKFCHKEGLKFEFVPSVGGLGDYDDKWLEVSIKVNRESGYYDRNVLPLLAFLNIVGASVLTMHSSQYFQRALLLLNISFVQVGIRMSLDSKLPSVGYEIKMQRIMNNYFYNLLSLALESSFVYFCLEKEKISNEVADKIDLVAVSCTLLHGLSQAIYYYGFLG